MYAHIWLCVCAQTSTQTLLSSNLSRTNGADNEGGKQRL